MVGKGRSHRDGKAEAGALQNSAGADGGDGGRVPERAGSMCL